MSGQYVRRRDRQAFGAQSACQATSTASSATARPMIAAATITTSVHTGTRPSRSCTDGCTQKRAGRASTAADSSATLSFATASPELTAAEYIFVMAFTQAARSPENPACLHCSAYPWNCSAMSSGMSAALSSQPVDQPFHTVFGGESLGVAQQSHGFLEMPLGCCEVLADSTLPS